MQDKATFIQVEGCDAVETADGMVVYQTNNEKVHYLNPTAAIVFELCDGRQSVGAITSFMHTTFELNDAPSEEVNTCIQSLLDEGIIRACPV